MQIEINVSALTIINKINEIQNPIIKFFETFNSNDYIKVIHCKFLWFKYKRSDLDLDEMYNDIIKDIDYRLINPNFYVHEDIIENGRYILYTSFKYNRLTLIKEMYIHNHSNVLLDELSFNLLKEFGIIT